MWDTSCRVQEVFHLLIFQQKLKHRRSIPKRLRHSCHKRSLNPECEAYLERFLNPRRLQKFEKHYETFFHSSFGAEIKRQLGTLYLAWGLHGVNPRMVVIGVAPFVRTNSSAEVNLTAWGFRVQEWISFRGIFSQNTCIKNSSGQPCTGELPRSCALYAAFRPQLV